MIEKLENKDRVLKSSRTPSFRIEAESGKSVSSYCFFGVFSISEVSDTHVSLSVRGGAVDVFGTGLALILYEGRSAEVKGRVEKIEISQHKIKLSEVKNEN